jgi:hypothetical protein
MCSRADSSSRVCTAARCQHLMINMQRQAPAHHDVSIATMMAQQLSFKLFVAKRDAHGSAACANRQ